MIPEFGYGLAFLTGFAGAFHCLGMCGGFASGYFASHGWHDKWAPQLTYHGVRIATYTLLGVAGALAGRVLVQVGMVGKVQGIVLMGSGLFIVGIGLRYLFHKPACPRASGYIADGKRIHFDRHKTVRRYLPALAGLLNGFVPCSLLFSIAVKSVASADPIHAALLMLCFGIGTLPMMVAVTTTGAMAGYFSRGALDKLTGAAILFFGAWTLFEGWGFYDVMRGLAG
jgi:uncharacterized protein